MGLLLVVVLASATFFVWRQGRIALRRFDEVHQLVSSLLNEVQAEAATVVGSSHVRRLLLEKAVTYLSRLEQDASGDRSLAQEIAKAYHDVADNQGHRRRQNLGLYQESLENHWKGIEIEKRLLASDPANRTLLAQLSRGYGHLAELYLARGESEKALEFGTIGVSMGDKANPRAAIDARFSLARVLHVGGQLEDALKLLQFTVIQSRELGERRLEMSALAWAMDQTSFLGLSDLTHEYDQRLAMLLSADIHEGEDRRRVHNAFQRRGMALSLSDAPSDERHCEAVPLLRMAAEGQLQQFNEDSKSINRMIGATTAYQFLSAAEAKCGLKEALQSAEQAIAIFNRGRRRENSSLDFHKAFAQFHLKQYDQAESFLKGITNPSAQLLELHAELALVRRQKEWALAMLTKAREQRRKDLSVLSSEWYLARFRLAQNIALSLRAGDTTPGLRREALQLLEVYPERGVFKSILKLREELKR